MDYRQIQAQDLPRDRLSAFWRTWFEAPPWLERFRCPLHNPFDDFTSSGRFEQPGACPECGTVLVPYWSPDRIDEYLRQVFSKDRLVVFGGVDGTGELAGWAWGYATDGIDEFSDLPANGLYVDHIGFDPAHNKLDVDAFLDAGERLARSLGFSFMLTRTHREAIYVKAAISPHGYQFLRTCRDEPDREYWMVPRW